MEDSQGTAANPSKVVKVTSTRSKRGREKLTGLFNDSAHSITVHRSGTLDFYWYINREKIIASGYIQFVDKLRLKCRLTTGEEVLPGADLWRESSMEQTKCPPVWGWSFESLFLFWSNPLTITYDNCRLYGSINILCGIHPSGNQGRNLEESSDENIIDKANVVVSKTNGVRNPKGRTFQGGTKEETVVKRFYEVREAGKQPKSSHLGMLSSEPVDNELSPQSTSCKLLEPKPEGKRHRYLWARLIFGAKNRNTS